MVSQKGMDWAKDGIGGNLREVRPMEF